MRAILFFSLILFFSSILLAPVLSASAAETGDRHEVTVLSWTPIKNLSDPHVQFIARFAEEENGNPQLKLNRVVFGATLDTQNSTISNTYGLVIETTIVGDSLHYYYQPVVLEIPKHSLELFSFTPIVEGWTPIKNLSDPHVQEIALFALDENENPQLKLSRVVFGATQNLFDASQNSTIIDYGLVIEVTNAGGPLLYYYQPFVLEIPKQSLSLVSFNPMWEKLENSRKVISFKLPWE